jgi:dihydropteroate synthase
MKIRVISIRNPIRRLQMAQSLNCDPDTFPIVPFLFKVEEISENHSEQIVLNLKDQQPFFHLEQENNLYFAPTELSELAEVGKWFQTDDISWETMIKAYHEFFFGKKTKWEWKNQILDFSKGPFIMGVLNVTPDSFSEGGRFLAKNRAVEHALEMVEHGADMIDVGGESTRPGSEPVSAETEQERILPVIKQIRKYSNVIISVDTYKSNIAKSALDAGADIINDISAGSFDPLMHAVVLDAGVPFIMMHIQGEPRNMQHNPLYRNATEEIYDFFNRRILELERQGHKMLIIDPGIGFGKRLHHNLELICHLDDFRFLGFPILIGTSRKSFIGKILNREVNERLAGTMATVQTAVENGADIVRVHDVKQVKDLITMFKAVENPKKVE